MLSKLVEFVNPIRKKISNGAGKYQADIILVLGVILISLLSFAVGFITTKQQEQSPIKFEEAQQNE